GLLPCIMVLLSLLALCLFIVLLVMDPGTVTMKDAVEAQEEAVSWEWCERCRLLKPPSARHCCFCGVCVRGQHHHCVVMGQCVGEDNKNVLISIVVILLVLQLLNISLGMPPLHTV
ncbi:hypothetical protein OTU49_014073, partial [Cherax quadricarinatus]